MNTDLRPHYRLRKVHIFFIVLFFCLAAVAKVWQYHWPSAQVELSGQTLNVLVAKTGAHQEKGLGGRETLAPYDGMLFLFGQPQKYAFVMRDTRFSIDIVWFLNGVVVDIAPRVPVEPGMAEAHLRRYRPRKEATVVLELPAGWAEDHGLKIGDEMRVIE